MCYCKRGKDSKMKENQKYVCVTHAISIEVQVNSKRSQARKSLRDCDYYYRGQNKTATCPFEGTIFKLKEFVSAA